MDESIKDYTNLFIELRSKIPYLSPALSKIADYVLENPEKIKHLTIGNLAKECDVSQGTITKFVKVFGLKNYQQLKIILTEITSRNKDRDEEQFIFGDISKSDSISDVIDKVVHVNLEALEDTKSFLDSESIGLASEAINNADIIDIYGCGGSFVAAENARLRFYRIRKICRTYNDGNQQFVSASLLTKKDVAIGISNSGRTQSVLKALEKAKENGATTICITNYDNSPIVKISDINLFTSTHSSTFFQEATPSRLAQLLVLDILYVVVAMKNYNKSIDLLEISSNSIRKTHN